MFLPDCDLGQVRNEQEIYSKMIQVINNYYFFRLGLTFLRQTMLVRLMHGTQHLNIHRYISLYGCTYGIMVVYLKVSGLPLQDQELTNNGIPIIVHKCVQFVESHGEE